MNANTPKDQLCAQMIVEVLDRIERGQRITMDLKLTSAVTLMGLFQKALEKKDLPATMTRALLDMARELEKALATTPALREWCRRGWPENSAEPIASPSEVIQ